MEINHAALAGLFVALVWVLIKVVEFFLKKYGNGKSEKNDSDKILKEINNFKLQILYYNSVLLDIQKCIKHLDELHCVYDDNHVPIWFVPREILPKIREISNDIDRMHDSLRERSEERRVGKEC